MAEPARRLWTLDEFLAFDDGTDRRYELLDGQIVAVTAPASGIHHRCPGGIGSWCRIGGTSVDRPARW